MEIVGIGTEIVECVRIARMIEQHGEQFLSRVFTAAEARYCRDHTKTTERFAATWAAKEAVLKTLAIRTVKNLAWTDVEICPDTKHGMTVRLQGAIKEKAERKRVREILITTAHCRSHATAYAIALGA